MSYNMRVALSDAAKAVVLSLVLSCLSSVGSSSKNIMFKKYSVDATLWDTASKFKTVTQSKE